MAEPFRVWLAWTTLANAKACAKRSVRTGLGTASFMARLLVYGEPLPAPARHSPMPPAQSVYLRQKGGPNAGLGRPGGQPLDSDALAAFVSRSQVVRASLQWPDSSRQFG